MDFRIDGNLRRMGWSVFASSYLAEAIKLATLANGEGFGHLMDPLGFEHLRSSVDQQTPTAMEAGRHKLVDGVAEAFASHVACVTLRLQNSLTFRQNKLFFPQ